MNKTGFNPGSGPKITSEKVLYAIILILIAVFIFNMNNVYDVVTKLRTGELFHKIKPANDNPPKNDDDQNEEPVDQYQVVTPVGTSKIACTDTIQSATGTKTVKVYLYYTDNKLKSLDEEVSYEGISDEYTNYIYSERKKYETRKSNNIDLKGYSVVTTLSGTLSLETSSVVDLSKTDLTKIKISDIDGIGLYGIYNQDINELTSQYASNGYGCE
jgi:hypothetical protein